MIEASDEVRTAVERLHRANRTNEYILVNPSVLRFSHRTGALVKGEFSSRPEVAEIEGILMYDPSAKQYLGFFPGDPAQDKKTLILPCTNGAKYDKTEEKHPVDSTVTKTYKEHPVNTCTVTETDEEN